MSSRLPTLPALFLTCLLLPLAACGPTKELTATDRQALDRQAQSLAAAGKHEAAAQIYLDKADKAEGLLVTDLRLDAGKTLLAGGLTDRALKVIGPASMSKGSPNQRTAAKLMLARHFESKGDLRAALNMLGQPIANSSLSNQLRILRLQSQYHLDLGELPQAIAARTRGLRIAAPQQQEAETLAIWQLLNRANDQQLASLSQNRATRIWADMADITRSSALDPTSLRQGVAAWLQQYGQQPGAAYLAAHVQNQFSSGSQLPSRIAVLLPLSGRIGEAGAAVRDGILAAYYKLPVDSRPALSFHDTSAIPANNLYAQVLGEGAQAIIGPLQKDALLKIASSGEPPVPVLALNQDPSITEPPANLYQFGLSPEDEAAAVARRLIDLGHMRSLIFTPEGGWGDRVGESFSQQYTELGGTVLATSRFDPKQKDFSAAIKAELGLDFSKGRSRDIMGLLGKRMEFEPRRRQDIQAVFLASPSWQARLVKPQFKFHHANDVPIFATSRVYIGRPDVEADRDLDGLTFPDAPWVIGEGSMAAERSRFESNLPEQNPNYVRFHALGFDALNLLPKLRALRLAAGQKIPGATGELYSDTRGQIHRELAWAEFTNGAPKLIVDAPQEAAIDETSTPNTHPTPTPIQGNQTPTPTTATATR